MSTDFDQKHYAFTLFPLIIRLSCLIFQCANTSAKMSILKYIPFVSFKWIISFSQNWYHFRHTVYHQNNLHTIKIHDIFSKETFSILTLYSLNTNLFFTRKKRHCNMCVRNVLSTFCLGFYFNEFVLYHKIAMKMRLTAR